LPPPQEPLGVIDVLISNAGFFPINMFEEMSQEEWQRVIDINPTGKSLVTRAVYGHMADRGVNGRSVGSADVQGIPLTAQRA
jgi:NAD(P)-dependent dehydrogenase (short-subunit alcohol dehydrogenase family)